MDEASENRLRETRASCNLDGAAGTASSLRGQGEKAYRAKVFKSGNSLALRLPKALGLEAGMEMELTVEAGGGYSLKPAVSAKRKFNVDKIWGIGRHLGLKPLKPEDRLFEERKLIWDDPDWQTESWSREDGKS